MNHKVSIIIPCYNQAEYLPETLDSVLAQTYADWECVIVDDGSTDQSCEVAQRYVANDPRFQYLYQANQGPSAARNNGIKHTNGEFVLPLDADDLIADTYLEKAVAVFASHPEMKLVYCKAKLFGARNQTWDIPNYSYDRLLWENMVFSSSVYRRTDYKKTMGYNADMREGLEDWDFWLSLLEQGDHVYRIDEELFFYRIKDISRNTNAEARERELLQRIYTNHPDKYESFSKDIIFYKRKEKNLLQQCKKMQDRGDAILMSREYRLGSLLLKPLRWLTGRSNPYA